MGKIEKMEARTAQGLSRRGFLKASGGVGVGLALGWHLGVLPGAAQAATTAEPAMVNPFVIIAPDGSVTVLSKHLDMGQGTASGLATLVAEEMGAAWAQMRLDFAPADSTKYNNLFFGTLQGTGGSTAMANSWEQYRKAGAAARMMLASAAAKEWGVPVGEVTVADGKISHASGKSAGFGDFAAKAAAEPVPTEIALKDAKDFVYIGKHFPRLDTPAKSGPNQLYTLDFVREGMLVAAVKRSPRFGGKLKSFDATEAKKVPGVREVLQLPSGVAVVAEKTWQAFKAREALVVEWDDSAAEMRSSDALFASFRDAAGKPGLPARKDGDAQGAMAKAVKVIEAEYEFPYLAHAPMEPHDVAIQHKDGKVDVWTGSQFQTVDQSLTASILGVDPANVNIHTLWAGGSFGRRAIYDSHIVAEAAQLAKAWGKPDVLKIMWSREDDIQGGYYRPMMYHKVKVGLGADGNPLAWQHHIVGQSIMSGTILEGMMKDGIDPTSVEGVTTTPYTVPNISVEVTNMKTGVPVLWWRSVGHTHTAYVMETMMDDLAREAGRDPLEYRLGLLKDHPRHAAVLKLAAEKAGYGKTLPDGHFHGLAVHESFNTYVAQVAEIAMDSRGGFTVVKVTCAVDCGTAINPDNVKAQMEGAIGYGLGHALRNEITLTDGVVDQANFDTYEPLRMSEMPEVEVHIVPSALPPTGAGEPGTPPIGPAVSNAVFTATGQRLRKLPMLPGLSGRA